MDAKHFEPLVTAHQRAVFAVAYGVVHDRARAEEICQDAFLLAWERLGRHDHIEDLRAWLCGIARNLARNEHRRVRPREALSPALIDSRPSPLDHTLASEDAHLVTEALAELPESLREPLVLHHFLDHSIDEVALTLSISTDNARQRLHRARRALRADLAPRFEAALQRARPEPKTLTLVVLAAIASRASTAHAAPLTMLSWKVAATVAGAAFALAALVLSLPRAPATAIHTAEASTPSRALATAASAPRTQELAAPSRAPTRLRAPSVDVTRIPSPPTAAWPAGADRRFTIHLNQADIQDVLKLFSDATGIPIRIEGPLEARVNVVADHQPALECIDEVLAQAGAQRTDAILDGKPGWVIRADEIP